MARKTYTTEQIIGILREVEVRLAKRVGIASYANIVVNRWTQLVRGIDGPSAREPERSSQKERRQPAKTSAFRWLLCPGGGHARGKGAPRGIAESSGRDRPQRSSRGNYTFGRSANVPQSVHQYGGRLKDTQTLRGELSCPGHDRQPPATLLRLLVGAALNERGGTWPPPSITIC
jgi:hypothetical protein